MGNGRQDSERLMNTWKRTWCREGDATVEDDLESGPKRRRSYVVWRGLSADSVLRGTEDSNDEEEEERAYYYADSSTTTLRCWGRERQLLWLRRYHRQTWCEWRACRLCSRSAILHSASSNPCTALACHRSTSSPEPQSSTVSHQPHQLSCGACELWELVADVMSATEYSRPRATYTSCLSVVHSLSTPLRVNYLEGGGITSGMRIPKFSQLRGTLPSTSSAPLRQIQSMVSSEYHKNPHH